MTLPFCHSRRELPTVPEAMFCVHPLMHIDGLRVREEICKMCQYWREPAPAEFRPFPPPPPRGRCRHLGDLTGYRTCETCLGHVQIKVFACSHPAHGETTWEECRRCPDHQEIASADKSTGNSKTDR
jgi:hypothetical protein